jgi:hypothetical protein
MTIILNVDVSFLEEQRIREIFYWFAKNYRCQLTSSNRPGSATANNDDEVEIWCNMRSKIQLLHASRVACWSGGCGGKEWEGETLEELMHPYILIGGIHLSKLDQPHVTFQSITLYALSSDTNSLPTSLNTKWHHTTFCTHKLWALI